LLVASVRCLSFLLATNNDSTELVEVWQLATIRATKRGFTLIEISTVVVILAILVAIALPSLATQSNLNASAAARAVLADLLYAQGQAIATGQPQYVIFTLASNAPGGTSGSYSLSDQSGTILTDPITKQLKGYTRTFGSGALSALDDVELADLTLDNPSNTVLVFDSRGEPLACPANGTPVLLANTGTIVLQSGEAKVTLSIEPDTGNITVSSNN